MNRAQRRAAAARTDERRPAGDTARIRDALDLVAAWAEQQMPRVFSPSLVVFVELLDDAIQIAPLLVTPEERRFLDLPQPFADGRLMVVVLSGAKVCAVPFRRVALSPGGDA